MYFIDRTEAGQRLAALLQDKAEHNCTLVALSDGAVVIAAQIAAILECPITMLMAAPINAPGEPDAVASINQEGTYSFNSSYSQGQQDEFDMEYHHVFEQQKMDRLSEMHRMLGKNELIRKDMLKGHTVILVADGLGSVSTIDSAALFLKSIKVRRLIIATPFAAVHVVDRMHILADEIACLNVVENYMGTDHYYENNSLPAHDKIIQTVQHMVQNWHQD